MKIPCLIKHFLHRYSYIFYVAFQHRKHTYYTTNLYTHLYLIIFYDHRHTFSLCLCIWWNLKGDLTSRLQFREMRPGCSSHRYSGLFIENWHLSQLIVHFIILTIVTHSQSSSLGKLWGYQCISGQFFDWNISMVYTFLSDIFVWLGRDLNDAAGEGNDW